MGKKIDIKAGEIFGKLTIVKEVESYVSPKGHKLRKVLCSCECGNNKVVIYNKLEQGDTKSCGCNYKEPRKHGQGKRQQQSPEYRAWNSMKYRCLNPNSKDYNNWGGKGVKIHQEWIDSFELFFKYIGKKPSPIYSLDRINPYGDYEPGNVRWATPQEQRINQRRMIKEWGYK